MWMQDKYSDSQPTIQKTAKHYQALSDVFGSLSLLSLVLATGLIEPQPLTAIMVTLAGLPTAVLSRTFIERSTTGAPSGTGSNHSHVAGTWATASHGTPEADHTNRWNRTRNSTGGRI